MTKSLDMFDSTGARIGAYELPEGALELEKGEQAVHDCVVAFLAGLRAGTACTKTRGKVRGGGAKPFRQKGLGRGRAGSSRNPVWTGGGVAFGPTPRDFSKKVNKKVAQLALKRAFSERVVDGSVIVVDQFAVADHKTKSAVAIFKNLNLDDRSVLLATEDYEDSVVCATRNLAEVVLRKAVSVNVYELLRFDPVLFTKDGLDAFIARLG